MLVSKHMKVITFYCLIFMQHKTFVLVVSQYDTIARARAQMLHILYELGKSDHQFRFRFKGVYLRDAYTFEASITHFLRILLLLLWTDCWKIDLVRHLAHYSYHQNWIIFFQIFFTPIFLRPLAHQSSFGI